MLFISLLCMLWCAGTEATSHPKEIAIVRRRSGLTHKEYLHYHTLVHGLKAWNAPRDNSYPSAYQQDYIYDAAFGVNDSVPNMVFVGRDDVTELYGSSATTFTAPPTTNYTETVIGPDGYNFNDIATAFSMVCTETIVEDLKPGYNATVPLTAFYWARSSNLSINNATFAANLLQAFLQKIPANTIYRASTHVPVPGTDSRPYFGGGTMPTINAVIKFWLNNTDTAITNIRAVQNQLNATTLSLDADTAFIVFSKAVTVWDLGAGIPFDTARLKVGLALSTIH
ncbi:hypothetical protein LTR95_011018 [Oleoguttula sp. CCFEE 5521]